MSLYSALAGMVSVNNVVPSSVISLGENSISLPTAGGRSPGSVPLILQPERPPSVSHVNNADWCRKTALFSGFFSTSERYISRSVQLQS